MQSGFGIRARFEPLKTIAFGAIGAAYTAVGTPTADYTRLVSLFNTMDKDILISIDGTHDHIRLAAGSGQVFDLTTNRVNDEGLFFSKSTQFWAKHAGVAPTSGNVWVQILYANGGGT